MFSTGAVMFIALGAFILGGEVGIKLERKNVEERYAKLDAYQQFCDFLQEGLDDSDWEDDYD